MVQGLQMATFCTARLVMPNPIWAASKKHVLITPWRSWTNTFVACHWIGIQQWNSHKGQEECARTTETQRSCTADPLWLQAGSFGWSSTSGHCRDPAELIVECILHLSSKEWGHFRSFHPSSSCEFLGSSIQESDSFCSLWRDTSRNICSYSFSVTWSVAESPLW